MKRRRLIGVAGGALLLPRGGECGDSLLISEFAEFGDSLLISRSGNDTYAEESPRIPDREISKLSPNSEKSKLSPVEIDLRGIEPGGWRRVARGNWVAHVRRRTPEQLMALRAAAAPVLDPAEDSERAMDPEWLVVLAECTHERCEPAPGVGAQGGWRCFCHGSEFDLSGRVLSGPAQRNLRALSYRIDGTTMIIQRAAG